MWQKSSPLSASAQSLPVLQAFNHNRQGEPCAWGRPLSGKSCRGLKPGPSILRKGDAPAVYSGDYVDYGFAEVHDIPAEGNGFQVCYHTSEAAAAKAEGRTGTKRAWTAQQLADHVQTEDQI